jgi:hypothetical protein
VKDHAIAVLGLCAIFLILAAATVMVFHGIKEDALLLVLFTGAVEIGKLIVGAPAKPPPGTKIETASTITTPEETPNPSQGA